MNFKDFYLKESNVFKVYEQEDIFLNADKSDIDYIKRNTSSGIKIGVIDEDEIYYWDADRIIHYDVEKDVIHKKFNLYLSWDKDENILGDLEGSPNSKRSIKDNKVFYDLMPKMKQLFGNEVKFEIEQPNDENNFEGKYV